MPGVRHALGGKCLGAGCAWAGAYLEWCMPGVRHALGGKCLGAGCAWAGAYLEWCMLGEMHAPGVVNAWASVC
jgi:hypothetical protein